MSKSYYFCKWCEDIIDAPKHIVYEGHHFCGFKCLGHKLIKEEQSPQIFKDFIEAYDLDNECAEWIAENYVDADVVYED